MRRFYFTILGLITLIGLYAVGVRLAEGIRVSAMTSYVPWGMWVSFYIYFIGLSAGSFLISSLIYVFGVHQFERMGRLALLSALFALGAGLLFVWIDLGHPYRFYEVFTRPGWSSVLKIESWLYLLYILLILGELWFLMRSDFASLAARSSGASRSLFRSLSLGTRLPATPEELRSFEDRGMRWVRVLGTLGVPVAIAVHGGTGAIFAVVKAKPYWFSGLFPLIFLVSALVSGAGLLIFLYSILGRDDRQYPEILEGMGRLILIFVSVDILMLMADAVVKLYGNIPGEIHVWKEIILGPFWYVFWFGQILMAYALPIFLIGSRRTGRSPFWLGAAGLSLVIGVVAVRFNLVIPAFLHPPLPGLEQAYIDKRLVAHYYFPSLWEWGSSLGVIALVVLVFSLTVGKLPVIKREEV